jgi:RND family efflux transporter MFP subunit
VANGVIVKRLKNGKWSALLIRNVAKTSKMVEIVFAAFLTIVGCTTALFLVAGGEEQPLPDFQPPALAVKTLRVKTTVYQVQVPAWGLIDPQETIDVRTEISGKVTQVSACAYAGATVKRGQHLFSIDARTYRNTLAEAMALHEQAKQALVIEKGRQVIAKTEWQLLERTAWGNQDNALALRKPQLKERQAAVQMAAARQAQAALDVEKTRITAPCSGVILREQLAEGQVVETGHVALQLACTDRYHLLACFTPAYSLDAGANGAAVSIAVGPKRYAGVVKAVLPQIHAETRQKQALVAFEGEGVGIGAYASLSLPGSVFRDVIVLPREALRPGDTVWVFAENGGLGVRQVTVIAQDPLNVVIADGLAEGDPVILSHIANPLQGMPLRRSTPATQDPPISAVTEERER